VTDYERMVDEIIERLPPMPPATAPKVYVANHRLSPDGGLDAQYLRKTMEEVRPEDILVTGAGFDSRGLRIEHGVAGRLIGKKVVVDLVIDDIEDGGQVIRTRFEILR
jgi:hypothetical protein